MTATVTPLREKQLIRAGDKLFETAMELCRDLCARIEDEEERATICLKVAGVGAAWTALVQDS